MSLLHKLRRESTSQAHTTFYAIMELRHALGDYPAEYHEHSAGWPQQVFHSIG